ncbi:beta-L-arabinofuranosidase domain-containing protein [Chitinophaga sp. MM2321]|uniref:glycoside hydrolase family 127 protein n=1 Tax=Chitinophaga sp. MM2321 TaxID=3137178 RepID=UPI0032D58EDB
MYSKPISVLYNNKHSRKLLAIMLLANIGFITPVFSQSAVKPAVDDSQLPAQSAQLNGYLGMKLDAAYQNRILAQDDNRLVAPFRNRTEDHLWQTEFWGKWFTSAVQAYSYLPEKRLGTVLDKTVPLLLNTQTPDGYIGNYADKNRLEQWDIWGQKYTLLGLLAYYDLKHDMQTLKAARRMADYLINELALRKALIVQQGNYYGMAATSILKPVVMLYARTNEKKYLDFAEEIVRQWELPVGPQLITKANVDVGKRFPFPASDEWPKQGQKAYEMMSCYDGLLDLYRLTGKETYKTAVEKTWQHIQDHEINITGSGSASECWYEGKALQQFVTKHANETCVTVTWLTLSAQLLQLTGKAQYADAIERSYYNALLGATTPDGSNWGMYTPAMGIRSLGSNQCGMGLNCCVANGPRGLFTIPPLAVMSKKNGLAVNFFADGIYKIKTSDKEIATLIQQTDYPVSGKVIMQLQLPAAKEFAVSIRIPVWSAHTSLMVNGQPVTVDKAGDYVSITRKWTSGDKVELVLDMSGRIERIEGQPAYLAILRGPLVLARDLRMAGHVDIDETITPVLTKEGTVPMDVIKQGVQSNAWIAVTIPCLVGSWRLGEDAKPVNLTFCNFSSAGSTFSPDSRYRIWFPQMVGANWGG